MEHGANCELYGSRATRSKFMGQMAAVSIVIVAALLRFYKLEIKPLHHDEGVNALFFLRLFGENFYQYDPANYHGPTLYYFTLIACSVSTLFFGARGLNTFAIRLVPALFGGATVCLILKLRDRLSTGAVLAGAALAAASPGATYFSRDYIHESIFVFLTLALLVAVMHWYGKRAPASLVLAAALAALLFATKETAVISVVVLILAFIATVVFASLERTIAGGEPLKSVLREMLDRFRMPRDTVWWLLGGIGVFLGLMVLFFSSFLGNYPKGLHDAAGALKFWVHVGAKEHRHSLGTYVFWLSREELPLLVFGVAGTVVAAFKRQRFALFVGLWAFGLLAAYSFIPYKTPWLTLNFIIPLAIVGGYAVEVIHGMLLARNRTCAWIWLALFVAAMTSSIYSALQLNFYHYDDDRNSYVYAQTRREFLSLVERINTIAHRSGSGEQTSIAVMSPDYWPLPWYLRDYRRVGYYGQISDANADIVIGSEPQKLQLALLLDKDYEWIGSYALRPGVILVVFARRHQS
jgi:uncharacterized protein (TIGR03663 family)